jgi:hypothetical protein
VQRLLLVPRRQRVTWLRVMFYGENPFLMGCRHCASAVLYFDCIPRTAYDLRLWRHRGRACSPHLDHHAISLKRHVYTRRRSEVLPKRNSIQELNNSTSFDNIAHPTNSFPHASTTTTNTSGFAVTHTSPADLTLTRKLRPRVPAVSAVAALGSRAFTSELTVTPTPCSDSPLHPI